MGELSSRQGAPSGGVWGAPGARSHPDQSEALPRATLALVRGIGGAGEGGDQAEMGTQPPETFLSSGNKSEASSGALVCASPGTALPLSGDPTRP